MFVWREDSGGRGGYCEIIVPKQNHKLLSSCKMWQTESAENKNEQINYNELGSLSQSELSITGFQRPHHGFQKLPSLLPRHRLLEHPMPRLPIPC